MKTKKSFYVFCFTVLGVLLGYLAHAFLEIFYIKLLVKDFVAYSFGLGWSDLMLMHDLVFVALIGACGMWGYSAGKHWWHQIYELKRKRWRPWF